MNRFGGKGFADKPRKGSGKVPPKSRPRGGPQRGGGRGVPASNAGFRKSAIKQARIPDDAYPESPMRGGIRL